MTCTVCGRPVQVDIDHDGPVEACQGCGLAQPLPRVPVAGIRRQVRRVVRERRLLGPACFGRRHTRCNASKCTCWCHDKEVRRE